MIKWAPGEQLNPNMAAVVHIYSHTYFVCRYIHTHARTHTHMNVYMYIHVYVHTHTLIYM